MKTDARFPYALLLCVASLGSLIHFAVAQAANDDSTAAVQPRDQQDHHDPGTRLQLSQSWQESFLRHLQAWERLERWPTRWLTGHYVAVHAVAPRESGVKPLSR